MSKLNVDQKSIKSLFQDKKADFLIPDYQRPYAWGIEECEILWEDIFEFAIPENDYTKFEQNSEYFLGPIVMFKNKGDKQEIIDGQQRLTTLMLLLRAFYDRFTRMKDLESEELKKDIERCIWKTDELGKLEKNLLKIDSEVATDDDKEEFLYILKNGVLPSKLKSNYAKNYKFFLDKIEEFLFQYPSYFPYLPARIINNCIILPIEAESLDTALRIFSTLNDRGLPLSDSDIFKSQFYKFFMNQGEKEEFINEWKELERKAKLAFDDNNNNSMNELFTKYMYYERAKQGIKKSTTEALRKFYEKDNYSLLKSREVFDNLKILVDFWLNIKNQDKEYFSTDVLKKLFVLDKAPNSMWEYFTTVYFMVNKKEGENGYRLDNEEFSIFLDITIGFIFAYAFTNPGVNALRNPVYNEMVKIVNRERITFENYTFNKEQLYDLMKNFKFTNQRPITKSILAWWAYSEKNQNLISLDRGLEIEHIFSKNRQDIERSLIDETNLESIGNKVLLETNINIRASDYRFNDKKKYYKGFTTSKGVLKQPTELIELHHLSDELNDFTEENILARKNNIINSFILYLETIGLAN